MSFRKLRTFRTGIKFAADFLRSSMGQLSMIERRAFNGMIAACELDRF